MPAIEGVASYGAAQQLFQPRLNGSGDSGTDNRTVQQFQVNPTSATPPAAPATETQTANAVSQANQSQGTAPSQQPAANDGGSNILNITLQLEQNRQAQQQEAEQQQQPASALNYGANGQANGAQQPTQAGRQVNLSV